MVYRSLFDDLTDPIQISEGRPVLLPIQRSLLERGRVPYQQGARRVIWQAPCGSGKTVCAAEQTMQALEKGKTVLHIVHRRRLVDQMIGTLNRFQINASPIMEGRQRWTSRVYCASRDTLLAMIKNVEPLPRTDVIIVDECHVAATEVMSWFLKFCPFSYWTGYTATPVKPGGVSMNPPWEALVSMGPTSALLEIGRLCPVKVYNCQYTGEKRRKGDKVKPVGDPIEHWKKYANDSPTVVFASTVKDSQAIVQRYIEAGITAEHIDAATTEEEREDVFERSQQGKTKVISNCGVLVEGVDLPWLVCCQILRGCGSLVLWVQATGRVMRTFPGKTHGIVLDHAAAAFEFGMPDSDFKWTLEDGAANELANKPPKERNPISCPKCFFVFVNKPACPECGHVMPRTRRQSLLESVNGDGVLTEFTEEQKHAIKQESLVREWKKLLYIGRAKGWTMGRVAGAFGRKAKMPPWQAGMDIPLPYGKDGWQTSVSDWLDQQRA